MIEKYKRNILIVICLLSIVLLCSCTKNIENTVNNQSEKKPSTNIESQNIIGTSAIRMIKSGKFAQQGEWIYFSNITEDGNLYKMKNDLSQIIKVYDGGYVNCINVIGEWVYFVNTRFRENPSICKIKIDGTDYKEITSDIQTDYMLVYKGNIYAKGAFIFETDGEMNVKEGIFKISEDNSEIESILVFNIDLHVYEFFIKDDLLYFVNDHKIHKINLNSNDYKPEIVLQDEIDDTCVLSDYTGVYSDEEYLYYRLKDTKNASEDEVPLYKMKFGNIKNTIEEIGKFNENRFIFGHDEEWLYIREYDNPSNIDKIYKMNKNTGEYVELLDDNKNSLTMNHFQTYVFNDFMLQNTDELVYSDKDNYVNIMKKYLYKIGKDGGKQELVLEESEEKIKSKIEKHKRK